MTERSSPPGAAVVAHSAWVARAYWIGFPLLGCVAAELLVWVLRWASTLPAVPLPGPLRLAEVLPAPAAAAVGLALGLGAGLYLARQAAQELLTVTVSRQQVRLHRPGLDRYLPGDALAGGFLDGQKLVLLGTGGEELAREPADLPTNALPAAFTRHGYRWHVDGDPYEAEYRRWVDDQPAGAPHPDLPSGADALLRARQRALTRKDRPDAADLRRELAGLGLVVRDEDTRQYWRPAPPHRPPR